MKNNDPAILFVAAFATMLAADALYRDTSRDAIDKQRLRIQHLAAPVRTDAYALTVAMAAAALVLFAPPATAPPQTAFLLGGIIGALHNAGNYAMLKHWDTNLAAVDTLWTACLFAATSSLLRHSSSVLSQLARF